MRINKYVALATSLSRRKADEAITDNRVKINNQAATLGAQVSENDSVYLDGKLLKTKDTTLIALNKPVGYVCSRSGQGNNTIYELLPEAYQQLKAAGRLDKDSSGLVLLSNDGQLLQDLSHPSLGKSKVYTVELNMPLTRNDRLKIEDGLVVLDDGVSKFKLKEVKSGGTNWEITMYEGRNRQLRRTFEHLGYKVTKLHRISVGPYSLGALAPGKTMIIH